MTGICSKSLQTKEMQNMNSFDSMGEFLEKKMTLLHLTIISNLSSTSDYNSEWKCMKSTALSKPCEWVWGSSSLCWVTDIRHSDHSSPCSLCGIWIGSYNPNLLCSSLANLFQHQWNINDCRAITLSVTSAIYSLTELNTICIWLPALDFSRKEFNFVK